MALEHESDFLLRTIRSPRMRNANVVDACEAYAQDRAKTLGALARNGRWVKPGAGPASVCVRYTVGDLARFDALRGDSRIPRGIASITEIGLRGLTDVDIGARCRLSGGDRLQFTQVRLDLSCAGGLLQGLCHTHPYVASATIAAFRRGLDLLESGAELPVDDAPVVDPLLEYYPPGFVEWRAYYVPEGTPATDPRWAMPARMVPTP